MNESKPNSWNESKPSFPAAMNVDEAMAYSRRDKDQGFWSDDMHNAMVTLAAEVERLRAELAEAKAENAGLGESHDRLEAELAAAKAASVCPEESVIWLRAVAAKLEKDGESSRLDSMTKAAIWLRERMKERGEQ